LCLCGGWKRTVPSSHDSAKEDKEKKRVGQEGRRGWTTRPKNGKKQNEGKVVSAKKKGVELHNLQKGRIKKRVAVCVPDGGGHSSAWMED